jgi:hypothetical protein
VVAIIIVAGRVEGVDKVIYGRSVVAMTEMGLADCARAACGVFLDVVAEGDRVAGAREG